MRQASFLSGWGAPEPPLLCNDQHKTDSDDFTRMPKRTEITIETRRTLVVTRINSLTALCPECGEKCGMVTIDDAATLARRNTQLILGWIESRQLHYIETSEGSLLICCNSLREVTKR
jgi:hypothetical protein